MSSERSCLSHLVAASFIICLQICVPFIPRAAAQPVTTIKAEPDELTISEGVSQSLTAVAYDAGGAEIGGVLFGWSSSDKDVVTVSQDGKVTGVSTGVATVTASTSGIQSQPVKLTVLPGQSSMQLIEEGLSSGALSLDEAILYKVLLVYNDQRLPSTYRAKRTGIRSITALMENVGQKYKSLSPETQDMLLPFFVPPFYEDSWYERRKHQPPIAYRASSRIPLVPIEAGLSVRPVSHTHPCGHTAGSWQFIDSAPAAVRIWWDSSQAAGRATQAQTVKTAVEKAASVLIPLMGRKPLADNPYPDATPTWGCDGGNAFLDIAIVDAFQTSTGTAMETTLGNTQVSALPGDRCKAWPAFIQIQADLQDFELKAATAHEYMHALLYGYNVKANCMSPEYSWINEATAQWAIEAVFHDGIQNYEQRPTGCFLNHPDLSIEHDPGLGGFSYRVRLAVHQ
jgi:hypothetical protein